MVLLRLLEAHCLPVVTYAAEVIHVIDPDERRSLRVAYNAVFRKVFSYKLNESVTDRQHSLGRLTWEEFLENSQARFIERAKLWKMDTLVKTIVMLISPPEESSS